MIITTRVLGFLMQKKIPSFTQSVRSEGMCEVLQRLLRLTEDRYFHPPSFIIILYMLSKIKWKSTLDKIFSKQLICYSICSIALCKWVCVVRRPQRAQTWEMCVLRGHR